MIPRPNNKQEFFPAFLFYHSGSAFGTYFHNKAYYVKLIILF